MCLLKKIVLVIICLFITFPVFAEKTKIKKNKYFDAIKIYNKKDLALNDVIEFSFFDMAEAKFINDSSKITISNKSTETKELTTLDAHDEIKKAMRSLPKYFYSNLKKQLHQNQVPITLYPSNGPSYSNPLKLYVKIKKVHLLPNQQAGTHKQKVVMRIFGQLKNKKTDEVIFKYYDSNETGFVIGQNQAKTALNQIADNFMNDLALFLKKQY